MKSPYSCGNIFRTKFSIFLPCVILFSLIFYRSILEEKREEKKAVVDFYVSPALGGGRKNAPPTKQNLLYFLLRFSQAKISRDKRVGRSGGEESREWIVQGLEKDSGCRGGKRRKESEREVATSLLKCVSVGETCYIFLARYVDTFE